ncbi:MAG: hydroxymethylbilane synthase, partial [Dehalococcoidia bacterium]|nr:hydroxymethylbilane synthase [Dehalococcoidia bacterium]
MDRRTVRIGTRGSALAIAQTGEVVSALRKAWPEAVFEVVRITPVGDRRKSAPLLSLGRGAFAKGVEEWLLDGRIDMAVHSAKDMPTTLPEGLVIAAYPKRKDARDLLVNSLNVGLSELQAGARLGTSSPRRSGQLLAARPDIEIVPIRGNVDTRLSRVSGDDLDGVALAAAGLERLGRIGEATEILDPELCVPDAGQGALAVETRAGDGRMREMAGAVNHASTWAAVTAE